MYGIAHMALRDVNALHFDHFIDNITLYLSHVVRKLHLEDSKYLEIECLLSIV